MRHRAFSLLSEMPEIGVSRDYANSKFTGMRMWVLPRFKQYLIFYTVSDESIEIVRVLHGAQNLAEIFKSH